MSAAADVQNGNLKSLKGSGAGSVASSVNNLRRDTRLFWLAHLKSSPKAEGNRERSEALGKMQPLEDATRAERL